MIQSYCCSLNIITALATCAVVLVACGSGDGSPAQFDAASDGSTRNSDAGLIDSWAKGDVTVQREMVAADRFVTRVVSFTPGACAGFGSESFPQVVYGPPEGGGADQGGVDVLSLGSGGTIVLSFEANPIVDGVGVDFLVFENPFDQGGDPTLPFAELAEVSVSDDGANWQAFPCTQTVYPYGSCAGWHPVYSASNTSVSAIDPLRAGGDPFDLADIGVARARFIRIHDLGHQACPSGSPLTSNGFDLDGVASVHAERP